MAKMQYVKSVSVPKHIWDAINQLIDRVHALEDKIGCPTEENVVMQAIENAPIAREPVEITESEPESVSTKRKYNRKER